MLESGYIWQAFVSKNAPLDLTDCPSRLLSHIAQFYSLNITLPSPWRYKLQPMWYKIYSQFSENLEKDRQNENKL